VKVVGVVNLRYRIEELYRVEFVCLHRGDGEAPPSLPACFAFDKGDPGENVWGTFGRAGRRPQSIGASSPHRMCALKPQSSHSNTGLHPRRLVQISHFAAIALEKKNPNGVHSGSDPPEMGLSSRSFPELLYALAAWLATEIPGRFAPGLMSVKRCMSVDGDGAVALTLAPGPTVSLGKSRSVDPPLPSVAAAIEMAEDAVWKDSMDMVDAAFGICVTVASCSCPGSFGVAPS